MRVLNVNAFLDPRTGGGTAERTFQLSRTLAAEGLDVTVLTLDLGLADERRRDLHDVRIVSLPCIQRRFLVPRVSVHRLLPLVRGVDVVHITGHWTPLNAIAYLAAARLGIPHVVCPAGALPVYGRSKLIKALFNRSVGYRIVRRAAAWVAITDSERSQFADYGVRPEQVTVIPNGVRLADFSDYDEAAFRTQFGLSNRPLILFMGRLNPIKGPDILLEAFARLGGNLSRYELVLAGPDEGLLDPLRRLATQLGVSPRVHFLGHISGSQKASAYHAADLLVVPSRQEAMSIVALEAGACAKPVLLTDRCGFDELHKVGGGRVVAATPPAISEALTELLLDSERLRAMGKKLLALVKERYTWEASARKYAKLFLDLQARSH